MKKILISYVVLILLVGFGTNSQSEPITLGFEGLYTGSLNEGDTIAQPLPSADPYAGIATFTNAIIGVYNSSKTVGYTYGLLDEQVVGASDGKALGYFGTRFITDPLAPGAGPGAVSSPITVAFSVPVTNVSFYAIDIDGGFVSEAASERFTASIYSGATLVSSLIVNDGDPGTGDAIATLIAFNNNIPIDKLVMYVERPNANPTNAGGVGIDLLTFQPVAAVPEPATMFLLGSGLIGIGVFARKKFKK